MTSSSESAGEQIGVFLLPLVLLPHEELALHATSRRQSQLIADLRRVGSEEFGMVFADRGSGPVSERTPLIGTVAEIDVSSPYTHGRWSLIVHGGRRFRVTEWLAEDPYPIAAIESFVEPEIAATDPLVHQAEHAVRRVRALLAELGDGVALEPDFDAGDDPVALSWKLAAASPLTPPEKDRLLQIEEPKERLELLIGLVDALYGDFSPLGHNGL